MKLSVALLLLLTGPVMSAHPTFTKAVADSLWAVWRDPTLPNSSRIKALHRGPVVVGILGVKKFQYDIWGDTVNLASRMETNSESGKVNISQSTYELAKDDPDFTFANRGKIDIKGKGEVDMYFVERSAIEG